MATVAATAVLLLPLPAAAQTKAAPAKAKPAATRADDGSVLPFPPTPSASVAGATINDSKMKWRKEPARLKPGAPNVLIVLLDDADEVARVGYSL
jgi:arylsulfatase